LTKIKDGANWYDSSQSAYVLTLRLSVTGFLATAEKLAGSSIVVRKEINRCLNTLGGQLVPCTEPLVAQAIGALHEIGDPWHVRHVTGEEWTFCKSFTFSHLWNLFRNLSSIEFSFP
jgi:hypothetical protein